MSLNPRFITITFILLFLFAMPAVPAQNEQTEALKQEETENYFDKWLNEDVKYIISDEERSVFENLTTDEEREQFIEQFWFRRDPDPQTAENEFKEEHYRRIAYANEKFTAGTRGWMTDRGRIYIIHGPPDNIEARPDGGFYKRPIEEGGGTTAVYPFEKWFYKYIEGVGTGVELEFYDPTNTGDYRLAVFDWEKDALLRTGDGPTLAEEMGLSRRGDHPGLVAAAGGAGYGPENWFRRFSDSPFERYERVAKVGAAPEIKYPDLKELIQVNISYENLPFETKQEYFRLNENQVLVPFTVQLRNKDLSFEIDNKLHVAKVAVYGIVTSLSNRIILEFEDDFSTSYPEERLKEGLLKSSAYQKILTLNQKNRYKLDLIVKDLNSGNVGVIRKAIIPPTFSQEELAGSSLVLSDSVEALERIPDGEEMFVLGDVRILPRLDGKFTNEMPLGVYFQVYNAALDQTTLEPSLRVTYSLIQAGKVLAAAVDEGAESTQFFSGRRVVLVKELSLAGVQPGDYQIRIEVEDLITDQKVEELGTFSVVGSGS
jgi:GWxTD domain-containing protein